MRLLRTNPLLKDLRSLLFLFRECRPQNDKREYLVHFRALDKIEYLVIIRDNFC